MKRAFDLALAAILAGPAIAVCLVCCALLWIVDGARPLFVQTRIGQFGNSFRLYKLRTMHASTLDVPSHEATEAQITPLGKLLRRTKLDELPQLLNVIMGDMSFVGPRPCLPSQIELINRRKTLGVLSMRPGITGVSQLAGLDMSRPEQLAIMDASYLGDWSLATDVSIIARTFIGRGSGDAIPARHRSDGATPSGEDS